VTTNEKPISLFPEPEDLPSQASEPAQVVIDGRMRTPVERTMACCELVGAYVEVAVQAGFKKEEVAEALRYWIAELLRSKERNGNGTVK